MHITYTGRHMDLAPGQVEKIEEQLRKTAKLLDGKARDGAGEQTAHVRLWQERHLHYAEVTVNFHHHALVGEANGPDLDAAVHAAIHKLDSQAVKVTKKWSDGKRVPKINESNAAD